MTANIVIIGDEILLGRVADPQSGLLARELTSRGGKVGNVTTVGDSAEAIDSAIRRAMESAELTISTGGLGPTRDDITKSVLTGIFGGSPRLDPDVLANVETIFARRGLPMNDLTRSQAMVPDSCRVVPNHFGTAPGMWFEKDGKVFVALPGVPYETRGILHTQLLSMLQEHFDFADTARRAEFTVTGIPESALAEALAPFEDSLPAGCHLAYLPARGIIVLRLDSEGLDADCFSSLCDDLRRRTADWLVGNGAMDAAAVVSTLLRERGLTLATAESCTGGNIASLVTARAGASDVYAGGVVSYSNGVKEHLLGVDSTVLATEGAVSEAVAHAMATGALAATGADCAVATTGIAGPGGGSADKPVGTVWIAAATANEVRTALLHLDGDRRAIIDAASSRALLLLAGMLRKHC